MFASDRIRQIAAVPPSVLAFRIEGGATSEEMGAMAEIVDDAFDRQGTVNMLLILHDYEPSDAMAGLSLRSLKTQARSVSHIGRYAVVGAPSAAARMIGAFDKVSNIEARAFDPQDEAAAWAFVGAQPAARDG